MARVSRYGVGPTDLLYGAVTAGAIAVVRPAGRLHFAMASFALLVVLVDWAETRRLAVTSVDRRHGYLLTLALTVPIVGTWLLLATRPSAALGAYFALLAAFFFLQAVRDAAVTGLSPIQLLVRGYANLVAVYLVFGAAADAVDRFPIALVILGVFVYLGRKSFRWGGAVLARLGWNGPA